MTGRRWSSPQAHPSRPPARHRQDLGASWWARRWLQALERFGWDERLRRGRTYARVGQVKSVNILPGRIDARVKGSRPRPYVVQIDLPPISDAHWELVTDALASQARYAAELLSGEMPRTVDEVFAEADARLFPDPEEPLQCTCSCPDWVNPCKHIAAVFYVVGMELDRDPFLLFQLRGRGRDAVISGLRARRAEAATDGDSDAGLASTPDEVAAEPPPDLETFWTLSPEVEKLRFRIAPPRVPEAVLKRLGTPFGRDDSRALAELATLYRRVSERAVEAAYEEA